MLQFFNDASGVCLGLQTHVMHLLQIDGFIGAVCRVDGAYAQHEQDDRKHLVTAGGSQPLAHAGKKTAGLFTQSGFARKIKRQSDGNQPGQQGDQNAGLAGEQVPEDIGKDSDQRASGQHDGIECRHALNIHGLGVIIHRGKF
ncbi:hypothetical protein SDC9_174296 [bioreactor metagenome]|uniref:Uncharacterized protein n=1 Tax=bioreactor metagenome TaxID=1076179 RepID=A0A645GL45_9ZZZZ